ncbi:MAG: hypothetical protein ACOYO1_08035 [Bacteroidales bacterium]
MIKIKFLLLVFVFLSCSTGRNSSKAHGNQLKSQIHGGSGSTGMELRKNKLKTCSKTTY